MPQKLEPKCTQCEKSESEMWRSVDQGQICNDCYEHNKNTLKSELEGENENETGTDDKNKLRKSTRSTRFKSTKNSSSNQKTIQRPQGRSRRCIFKKMPFKSPSVVATTQTCDNLFYKNQYYQLGDIVSLMDKNDDIYYAQIRGLLVDTFCEKSAFLTWLIPTQSSPPPNDRFEPSTYIIGPDEDLARKLACMEFVMNAPSNYYRCRDNPYPAPDSYLAAENADFSGGFIWQNMIETN